MELYREVNEGEEWDFRVHTISGEFPIKMVEISEGEIKEIILDSIVFAEDQSTIEEIDAEWAAIRIFDILKR